MKTLYHLIFILILSIALRGQDVPTPQKRMLTLDIARKLLTTDTLIEAPDVLESKNPFNRKSIVSETKHTDTVPVPAAVSDRDLLMLLAPQILPTGSLQMGGKVMLLFGQKRLKIGDSIPIVFKDSTYDIKVSSIDRTTFTLRYNNEEIIRPIKSVSK
jgi:hypothetical protein